MRMSLIDMFPISSLIIDGPASLRIASDKVVFTAMHLQILENEFENDTNPERVDGSKQLMLYHVNFLVC